MNKLRKRGCPFADSGKFNGECSSYCELYNEEVKMCNISVIAKLLTELVYISRRAGE